MLKKIYFFIFFLAIPLNASFSQTGWSIQNSGTGQQLNKVKFVNQFTGWIVGNSGSILKTTNGGTNWIIQLNNPNYVFYGLHFYDVNTGWAVGGNDSGLILKTTNGGLNWFAQITGIISPLITVHFINQNTGWTASGWGEILNTTNGGQVWFLQTNYFPLYLFSTIYFLDQNTGFIAGGNNIDSGLIKKTINGGISWTNLSLNINSVFISGFSFTSSNNGLAVGFNGTNSIIIRTTNGGSSWSLIQYNTGASFNTVYCINNNIGWVSGSGGNVFKTTNGGLNWYDQATGYNDNLISIYFNDPSTGWTVGNNGVILKTTTGGDPIGIKPISSQIPSSFHLYQNYPNPFNPSTKIKFDIGPPLAHLSKEGMGVVLKIYDILGCEVVTLVNEKLSSGTYEVEWNPDNNPSGVYFYKLTTGDFTETKRMILLK